MTNRNETNSNVRHLIKSWIVRKGKDPYKVAPEVADAISFCRNAKWCLFCGEDHGGAAVMAWREPDGVIHTGGVCAHCAKISGTRRRFSGWTTRFTPLMAAACLTLRLALRDHGDKDPDDPDSWDTLYKRIDDLMGAYARGAEGEGERPEVLLGLFASHVAHVIASTPSIRAAVAVALTTKQDKGERP